LFFPAILVCAWHCWRRLVLVAIALSAVAVHVWVLVPDPIWTVTLTESVQVIAFVAVTVVTSTGHSALAEVQTRFAVTLVSIGDAVIVTDIWERVTCLNDTGCVGVAPQGEGRPGTPCTSS
jgi:hypothetical protein